MPPMIKVLVYEKCRHYPDSEYVSLKMTRELEKVFENNPNLPSVSLLKLVQDIVREHLPDKTIKRAQILVDDEYMDVGTEEIDIVHFRPINSIEIDVSWRNVPIYVHRVHVQVE